MSYVSLVAKTSALLDRWSFEALEIIKRRHVHTKNELAAISRGTLKFPADLPSQISLLETRIGRLLPESYKAFLEASGGFFHPGIDGRFFSASEVGMFLAVHPEQVKILSDGGPIYYVEETEAAPRSIAGQLVLTEVLESIAVSEVESGQFFGLLPVESKSCRRPIAFAFDFWGLPRLYESFTDLLLDEMSLSLEALRS